MTLDELIQLQRDRGLVDVHLVDVDDYGWRCAHTDHERQTLDDLTDCELHVWLAEDGVANVDSGVYVVTPHEPDTYSEDFGVEPWDLEPLTEEGP